MDTIDSFDPAYRTVYAKKKKKVKPDEFIPAYKINPLKLRSKVYKRGRALTPLQPLKSSLKKETEAGDGKETEADGRKTT